MASLPRFSVSQPVLVNLLMITIIVGGLFSLLSMPQELNPNISFNWVFVTILYPGASPEEVEDLVVIPVEKELDKIDKVDDITSTAGEGFAFFLVKFDEMSETDFTAKLQEVRLQVDKADIPDETEDPEIDDFGSDDFIPVLSIAITFDSDWDAASRVADDLEEEIERVANVAKIQVSGLEDREIWVEVDPVKLTAHRLTLGAIVHALHQRNVNFPGGNVTIGRTEFLVRALSRFESPEEITALVLRADPQGRIVYLRDVATVRAVRAETSVISRLNGRSSITISVSKKAGSSTFQVVEDIKTLLASIRERAPDGIDFAITIDSTDHISKILGVLRNNALVGIVFIFVILLLFLGLSNALLASLGIPLSFFVAFILMYLTGNTVNGSSIFAMIIVLGIIVDDAIIVLENVHSHRQRGKPLKQAVIEGTEEVLGPVTAGILTTVAAFVPLMLLPGIMGKFMRVIPIVVSLALLASLFEATALLPAHINDWTRGSTRHRKPEFGFYLWLRVQYKRLLRGFLKKRYLVITGMVVLLGVAIAAIPLVGIELFGHEDLGYFTVLVKMPEGTALEETDRIIRKVEEHVLQLPAEELQYAEANSGLYQGQDEWLVRKSVGQVVVRLHEDRPTDRSVDDIIRALRPGIEAISGILSLEFERPSGGPPQSKPIAIRVVGKYFEELRAATRDIKEILADIEGVHDIQDDFPEGKEEIRVRIDEERAALFGLSAREIARELRTAIAGLTATTFRDGDEDVDVVVKLQESADNSLEQIRALRLTSVTGATIPLSDVAAIELRDATGTIKRRNLERTIIVSADIDEDVTSVDKAVGQVAAQFDVVAQRYDEIDFEIGGAFEEFMTAFNDIAKLFAIGVLLIFLILGTQFKSYIQPLVILSTVPFAFIGAMVGLLIGGDKFGISTLFGVVALAGIVVNDSIVMITFINNARRDGEDRWQSIVSGGVQRLRPIILTTVTTIGGLLPTVVGIGGTSAVWRPLANTIAWGLLFSTVLTLLVIPCTLSVVDDIKVRMKKPLVREE
ncbi:MAG: efflux RND transporter permease subunit [Candidatus Eisenbacteria sp.]|nr:efflux RND transporter permease subunit [Candidatus Eisenbacteria bacterium]